MQFPRAFRFALNSLLALMLVTAGLSQAADYETPLAAIAANPQLSDIYALLKKTGYAEPLGVGGDITFLALTNKLLSETTKGSRFTNIELLRDKIPPEAQLLILQAMTLDGQYTQTQFSDLVTTQGSGKATIVSVLGKDASYHVYRGKDAGTFILEDSRHNGALINTNNAIVTGTGVVIVIDSAADIPK